MKKIVALLSAAIMLLLLSSCDMPKIKKRIPNVETVTLSDSDSSYLKENYSDVASDIEKSLTDNISVSNELYKRINKYRQQFELDIVKYDTTLSVIASVRAEEIAQSGKFSHHRPDDKGYFSTAFQEYGFDSGNVGENLAKTYKTEEEAFDAWRNSSYHNACMLDKRWTKIGIGYAEMEDGTPVWVTEFSD